MFFCFLCRDVHSPPFKAHGKSNLNNACLFQHRFSQSKLPCTVILANSNILPREDRRQYRSPLTLPGFQTILHGVTMFETENDPSRM